MKQAGGTTNMRALLLIICMVCTAAFNRPGSLMAQELNSGYVPTSRILFIFDASNSMAGQWDGSRKIDMAREVLFEMVDSLEEMPNVEMALRVYGHQSPVTPQDCSDTNLEVPFATSNASRIKEKLRYIDPKGTTPIAHSLELAADDFPLCNLCRNIVVLITDGIEACDGDPCEVSEKLQKRGAILRPFVIGIGNDIALMDTYNCIGEYYDAPTIRQFRVALKQVITQALDATSAQVNLLDSRSQPTETDVNVVLYDSYSGLIRYNMIHTLNSKGNPDTIALDHLITYDVVAQTIPPVRFDSVKLAQGRHNTISMDAPQGYLYVRTSRGKSYDQEKFLVRKAGESKTINIQKIGNVGKYLVGRYDLEIPIYPLMEVKNVEILQSHTTTLEIPAPGFITFTSPMPGSGSLYKITGTGDQQWVLNLLEDRRTQAFLLQPGHYRVIFRRGDYKSTSQGRTSDFVVREGTPDNIKL
jgi:Ca-activated chloride channel homolog